jgi:hypothetical protein
VFFKVTILPKMLETHRAGKTTKKRQNSDTSTPLACTELPKAMKYRETRRVPMPPGTGS